MIFNSTKLTKVDQDGVVGRAYSSLVVEGSDWTPVLKSILDDPAIGAADIDTYLRKEERGPDILPPTAAIFNAFKFTPLRLTKVVILGQDPYPTPGQATGLAFSVPNQVKEPPSLRNIKKEMRRDIGLAKNVTLGNNLSPWALQGVLLLNTVLTTRKGARAAHRNIGWERFVDAVVRYLAQKSRPPVFVLWGQEAKQKANIIESAPVLSSPHPSPLSASKGFFFSSPFTKVNEILKSKGVAPIDWERIKLK